MRVNSVEFDQAVEATRRLLREVAARDEEDPLGYATYKWLSLRLGELGHGVPYHAGAMPHVLGEVSRREHNEGRGMLSALVVQGDTRQPADGFCRFARGEPFNRRGDDDELWLEECRRLRRENSDGPLGH